MLFLNRLINSTFNRYFSYINYQICDTRKLFVNGCLALSQESVFC